MTRNQKNIGAFFLVVLFFVAPIVGAWWFFKHANHTHLKTVNHGILLQPPLALDTLALTTEKAPFHILSWKNQWVLVYINPKATCDTACQHVLYYMRQVRLASGKNQDRLTRAYVSVNQQPAAKTLSLLKQNFSGTIALNTSTIALQQFLSHQDFSRDVIQDGQLFVIDPNGWVMMRYPVNFSAKDLLDDLTRLLQVN